MSKCIGGKENGGVDSSLNNSFSMLLLEINFFKSSSLFAKIKGGTFRPGFSATGYSPIYFAIPACR